jgi:hypothetical protein
MQTGIYKHYKGGYYLVLGVGQHTETKELMVAYVALTGIHMPGPRLRFRPLDGPEGWDTPWSIQGEVTYPRFVYCGDELGDDQRPSELPQAFEPEEVKE